ncbi:uncharacterized protein M421DRAFT_220820 [Didymella exigua CBS 183.55]|uniref:Zn(2)-C6 fungal-type domain-containing protein n=1 Tax=Didymella exigua CBS 183.55 TaxID=1150837 RepID=A0A6A5RG51_9PLEO|nr:uncharacterized protein M421DRAFT_220820 [Didymella exigua CBS 183.55]KAF1926250.1 hypothetical protein M421DRAFT_220820 [Didymella exigua CBS 183.55]
MLPSFRPLAPAPPGGPLEPSGSEPRKRKKKARLACNHCRVKRVGCDGARPDCARCLRSRVPCVYISDDADATPTMALKSELESLQRRLQEHADLLESIRSAPDDEVLAIVHRLRSAEDLSVVLSAYQGRIGGSSQASEHALARAVMPSAETAIDFELVMLHPTAFPVPVPPSPSSMASAGLMGGSSPSGTPMSPPEPYTYCDPRLELLAVSYWTRIPIDSRLAARAISHFLETDHPVLGFFDAHLFLRDLVEQGLGFCSSFLFHAVMSLACQSYSTVELRVAPFATAFTEEAIKLWHAERLTDSATTLAALNCLSVATGWNARNQPGNHELVGDASAMATRIQLFHVPPTDASIDHLRDLSEDEMRDQAHVAWGSYGCQSFLASFFPKPSIRYPPRFPIPGDNPDLFAASDAFEPAHQAPNYIGQTCTAMCKFWTIVQEILAVCNTEDDAPPSRREGHVVFCRSKISAPTSMGRYTPHLAQQQFQQRLPRIPLPVHITVTLI